VKGRSHRDKGTKAKRRPKKKDRQKLANHQALIERNSELTP